MPELMAHPWINEGHAQLTPAPPAPPLSGAGLHRQVLAYMRDTLHFEEDAVVASVEARACDRFAATYHLLELRMLHATRVRTPRTTVHRCVSDGNVTDFSTMVAQRARSAASTPRPTPAPSDDDLFEPGIASIPEGQIMRSPGAVSPVAAQAVSRFPLCSSRRGIPSPVLTTP